MKAIKPTVSVAITFSILFNIFMYLIQTQIIHHPMTWKLFGAHNFIVMIILLNWLPKSETEMDEREKSEYLKIGSFLFNFTSILIAVVFSLHIIWWQSMTVIEFVLLVGIPGIIAMSVKSQLIRKEMND